ncbi:MAG: ornithine carbamoyltransferase [Planctomycetota bacterium]|nr:ornithine carbamoyltransferase [Planctomycetota bacterium]
MSVRMKGRHLLAMKDLTSEELRQVLDTAKAMKLEHYSGRAGRPLAGKVLGMIFQKPSTRTRVSFEAGMAQLGGTAIFLSSNDIQLKRGETVSDTAHVLSRYCDCLMARVFAHQDVVDLAQNSRVSVINGLSDFEHPCQILADLQTILEKKGTLAGLKLAYVGDGNNVCHSLMAGAAMVGMDVAVGTPKGYEPKPDAVDCAKALAKSSGSSVMITTDPARAARGADVIYTDVWASMGQESEHDARVKIFHRYQINAALMKKCKPDVLVMHCLPAHRGEEISEEAIDGPNSVVFDQAENRLHAQKALLVSLM